MNNNKGIDFKFEDNSYINIKPKHDLVTVDKRVYLDIIFAIEVL